MKKHNKKGQVTIYIILGIVLVASVLFMLYLTGAATKSKLVEEQRKVIANVLDATVNIFAQSCIKDALDEGLDLMGRQGGVIYTSQKGLTEEIAGNFLGEDKVNYGLKMVRDWPGAPAYPCTSLEGEPDYCRYPETAGAFGRNTLPLLSSGGMKEQLEYFVEQYVKDCVNFNNLPMTYEVVELGQPEATAIFSDSATAVKVTYPLQVKIGQGQPVSQLMQWEGRKEVRLKLLQRVISDILDKDSRFAAFEVEQDIHNETIYQPNLFYPESGSIFFRKEKKYGADDLLIFNDTSSRLKNQPYLFQVARQNRPPALEWINRYASLDDYYDYLAIEDEKVNISQKAADPDEDNINYDFSQEASGTYIPSGDAYAGANLFFLANKPGGYNLTATARDEHGIADWQVIRLLVDNKLVANFTVRNRYFNTLTREEPIVLNASLTTDSLDPGAEFYYFWVSPFENMTRQECVVLPGLKNCSAVTDYNIETIKEDLARETYDNLGSDAFELEVEVKYNGFNQTNSTYQMPEIKDCYPYRDNNMPAYTPGYTAGQTVNHYFTNHTCCLDNFTYAPNTTVCYTEEENKTDYGWTSSIEYKEVTNVYCSGNRGNICNGNTPPPKNVCREKGVNENCKNQEAYSLVKSGWCYGRAGCKDFCTSPDEIVDNGNGQVDAEDECGCGEEGAKCDSNFDGLFEGVCQDGECVS